MAAAREAFVEHGPEMSLDEIAHPAGVGATTLIQAVRVNPAAQFQDPYQPFRAVVFTCSSDMSEREVATFLPLPDVTCPVEHSTVDSGQT